MDQASLCSGAGRHRAVAAVLALTAHTLIGIGLGGWALWLLLGREEWRVRRGLLTIHRAVCGWGWERRFGEGWFRLVTDTDGNSHLLVQPPGGAPTVLLHGIPADAARLRGVGELLAGQTGWALRDADQGLGVTGRKS